MAEMSLEAALEQFDATDANLRRLEQAWSEMESLVPSGIVFSGDEPEQRRYRELALAYRDIMDALPAISGYRITAEPLELNDIAQRRLDHAEIDEISIAVQMSEDMRRPADEIERYRFLLDRARREVVRGHFNEVFARVDGLLADLLARFPADVNPVQDSAWDELVRSFGVLERLAGDTVPRGRPWGDLRRHLHFGQGQDLHAIASSDWPAVKAQLKQNLYAELEPLPVNVEDLGDLVASRPTGTVTTALNWSNLDEEGFERLLFDLIADTPGYENPQWLTHTNAPDRGRDLSVERVRDDPLTGTLRERVILQARHWLARSLDVPSVSTPVAQMALWEPPPVDVLIIATSGRFTTDGVEWIEGHNRVASRICWKSTDGSGSSALIG